MPKRASEWVVGGRLPEWGHTDPETGWVSDGVLGFHHPNTSRAASWERDAGRLVMESTTHGPYHNLRDAVDAAIAMGMPPAGQDAHPAQPAGPRWVRHEVVDGMAPPIPAGTWFVVYDHVGTIGPQRHPFDLEAGYRPRWTHVDILEGMPAMPPLLPPPAGTVAERIASLRAQIEEAKATMEAAKAQLREMGHPA